MIQLDITATLNFIPSQNFQETLDQVTEQSRLLLDGSGPGGDMLGWLDLPEKSREVVPAIQAMADEIRRTESTLICIGIGGSYLGAQAAVGALNPGAKVVFAGHHLSAKYLAHLMARLKDQPVYLNVISKSGTTLEPAIAFRILRQWLQERYPDDWRERIILTTDPDSGVLRDMVRAENLRSLPIPPDVGGRYSVLSSAGLLPMAAAGIAITEVLDGALGERRRLLRETGVANAAHALAAVRTCLYRRGYKIEILSSFLPELGIFAEWWKQLAGESEGKEGQGLFPAACSFTTDLHSLGQWIQEGERTVFETFIRAGSDEYTLAVPVEEQDSDGLNYLAGQTVGEINQRVYQAVVEAHRTGGVPSTTVSIPAVSAGSLGALFFFFELTVALSGYQLGINPFDQPGVEAYKKEMFQRLGKRVSS